jgi:8-oxo-dGTP pyrophosphatase MutT (NUDIX family)
MSNSVFAASTENLTELPARRCLTVAGVLIHDGKVMLIKHIKSGLWLAPGGHVDPNELPHKAAERECWEETGIKTRAISVAPELVSTGSAHLPHPFCTNLHWINEENYRARIASENPDEPQVSAKYPRGCEQHLNFMYLLQPVGSTEVSHQIEEVDAAQWVSEADLDTFPLYPDVADELVYAFSLAKKLGLT